MCLASRNPAGFEIAARASPPRGGRREERARGSGGEQFFHGVGSKKWIGNKNLAFETS